MVQVIEGPVAEFVGRNGKVIWVGDCSYTPCKDEHFLMRGSWWGWGVRSVRWLPWRWGREPVKALQIQPGRLLESLPSQQIDRHRALFPKHLSTAQRQVINKKRTFHFVLLRWARALSRKRGESKTEVKFRRQIQAKILCWGLVFASRKKHINFTNHWSTSKYSLPILCCKCKQRLV